MAMKRSAAWSWRRWQKFIPENVGLLFEIDLPLQLTTVAFSVRNSHVVAGIGWKVLGVDKDKLG